MFVRIAGALGLPAVSVAIARRSYAPSDSGTVFQLEDVDQEPPSTLHSNVEPLSDELNEKLGVALLDGFAGDASIVVSGAVLSTRRFATTLEVVVLPALSVAIARRS